MSAPLSISTKQVAVTPDDAVKFPGGASEGLWIGVGGTLSYLSADPSVPAGTALSTTVQAGLFPCRCLRVNATGTAATGILALY